MTFREGRPLPYTKTNDCRRGGNLPPEKQTALAEQNGRSKPLPYTKMNDYRRGGNLPPEKNGTHQTKREDNILPYEKMNDYL